MRRRSKPSPAGKSTWCWQRRIAPKVVDAWIQKLEASGTESWAMTSRPGRVRSTLSVYFSRRVQAVLWKQACGGQIKSLRSAEWMAQRPTPVLRIGSALRIHHSPPRGKGSGTPSLYIPQGLAFGSGEHATTYMLLRALTRRPNLAQERILDLGTGSGVLALAARKMGASRIVATDFDAEAIRTAAANERLNFSQSGVTWREADVRRLRSRGRFQLVLANLFSGILCEAAEKITGAVSLEGDLWLSGILLTQQSEVVRTYDRLGLKLERSARRGKWVMLQWKKFSD